MKIATKKKKSHALFIHLFSQRHSARIAEMEKPIDIQHVHEGREEAIKRAGKKNLGAKDPSYVDFLKYLVENRIAANHMFPFLIIMIIFTAMVLVLGAGWYCLGLINPRYSKSSKALFGLTSFEDAVFMALQVLSFGEWNDIPAGKGLRFWYYLEVFLGLGIFAVVVAFITDNVRAYMEALQSGSTRVLEKGHTLIIGWNESTARVVVQTSFLRRQYQVM